MLTLSADVIEALPVDERALLVLQDLVDTNQWNEHNYLITNAHEPVGRALAEAMAWLRGHAFIARTPGQSSSDAIFVTPRGHEALRRGFATVRAAAALEHGLHPLLVQRVRRQFLLGEYEQAVFVAMKAVEVRVRSLSKLGDAMVGVPLMTQAFREGGLLVDPDAVPATPGCDEPLPGCLRGATQPRGSSRGRLRRRHRGGRGRRDGEPVDADSRPCRTTTGRLTQCNLSRPGRPDLSRTFWGSALPVFPAPQRRQGGPSRRFAPVLPGTSSLPLTPLRLRDSSRP